MALQYLLFRPRRIKCKANSIRTTHRSKGADSRSASTDRWRARLAYAGHAWYVLDVRGLRALRGMRLRDPSGGIRGVCREVPRPMGDSYVESGVTSLCVEEDGFWRDCFALEASQRKHIRF
jgi:hypothetical protein